MRSARVALFTAFPALVVLVRRFAVVKHYVPRHFQEIPGELHDLEVLASFANLPTQHLCGISTSDVIERECIRLVVIEPHDECPSRIHVINLFQPPSGVRVQALLDVRPNAVRCLRVPIEECAIRRGVHQTRHILWLGDQEKPHLLFCIGIEHQRRWPGVHVLDLRIHYIDGSRFPSIRFRSFCTFTCGPPSSFVRLSANSGDDVTTCAEREDPYFIFPLAGLSLPAIAFLLEVPEMPEGCCQPAPCSEVIHRALVFDVPSAYRGLSPEGVDVKRQVVPCPTDEDVAACSLLDHAITCNQLE